MKKGVTIIELLIAILIVGMLSLGLAYMITSGLKVWSGGKKRTELLDQGRISMERFSRELRQAVRNTLGGCIVNDIKFNAVLGGSTTYIVEYKLSETALQRSEKTSAGAADDFVNIAESVNNLNITYYNSVGGVTSTPSDVRTVRVTLVMDMPDPEQDINITTEVRPRNFMKTGE